MNKTTEALKLAEEALNAMLTHMGMDEDEWTKPTFNQAREALAAIREALDKPVKQEPVAHYKDAPHTIYLQTGCDDPEDCECSFNEWGDTTWCADQIHDTDIPYIRADYAAPVDAKAIRAEALEEAAKVCDEEAISWAKLNAQDEEGYGAALCASTIRARGEK